MKHIPNIITSLNLASGFLAIIFLFIGEPLFACWLVVAGMIFDFMDGFASRLLKAYSDMGKELDSLADLVSFGVVPGIIIFGLISKSANPGGSYNLTDPINILYLVIPALMPVCAGLRLAKFNIDSSQKTSFKGLPTPANALAVISVVMAGHYGDTELTDFFISNPYVIIFYSLILSVLMITRLPLLSLKFANLRFKDNLARYIVILLSIVSVAVIGIGGIIFIIPAYVAVSVIFGVALPSVETDGKGMV